MALKLKGSTSGFVGLDAPSVAGNNTLILPENSGSAFQVFANDITAGVTTFTQVTVSRNGDLTVPGTISIGGTLTYEDVTSVDSIGIVTARGLSIFGNTTGLSVTGVGTFANAIILSEDNAIHFRGTSADDADAILRQAAGGGQLLINSRNDTIINIDSNNDGTDAHFAVAHNAATGSSTELFRVQEDGKVGIGTATIITDAKVHIVDTGTGGYRPLVVEGSATNGSVIEIRNNGAERIRIGSGGANNLSGSSVADGLIRTEANMLFAVGNSEKLRIDSTGALGLGVNNAQNNSGNYRQLQIGFGAHFYGRTDDSPMYLSSNAHYNSGWKYTGNTTASQIILGTNIQFFNAPSGNADDAVTFTERLRIASDGRVLIGRNSTTNISSNSALTIQNPTGSSATRFNLINSGSSHVESTQIFSQNNDLAFIAGQNERLRIKSGGNIGINITNPAYLFDVQGTSVISRFKSTNNNNIIALSGNNASD